MGTLVVMKFKLIDQNRKGVPSDCDGMVIAGRIEKHIRITDRAHEDFVKVGSGLEDPLYYLFTKPPAVVPVLAPCQSGGFSLVLRHKDESPIPGEKPSEDIWFWVDLAPCPKCGYALAWYECGYVSGYRFCCGPDHHHWIVAVDRF